MGTLILKNKKVFGIFVGILFGIIPMSVFAAYLYTSPNTVTIEQGKTFTMTIAVASASKSTNAVSGTLTYPADMVTVTGVSSGGSIVQQWLPPGTTGPRSLPGSIRFEGVMINGFQGASGRIFTVTFRAKQTGDATLSFAADQILANDGNATDITDPSKTAVVHIVPAKTPAPAEPTVTQPVVDDSIVATTVEVSEPVVDIAVEPVSTNVEYQPKDLVMVVRYLLVLIAALLAIIILLIIIIIILVYRGARGRDAVIPTAPPSRAPRSRRKIAVKSSVMND